MWRLRELVRRFGAADAQRLDDSRALCAARSGSRLLAGEESLARSIAFGRVLGLTVTAVGLILIVVWLVNLLSFTQPIR